jgi:hypothetical protein
MRSNREIAEAFAAQFEPPLTVVHTERINNRPVADAWLVAYFDKARGYGITAHAFGGRLHAYLEAGTDGGEAEHAGRLMAKALGMQPG